MPISADLGAKLEAVVENLVRNGRYNSKSEVLREGVRLVQEREARLAAVVEQRENWLRDEVAVRDVSVARDPSAAVPMEDAFDHILIVDGKQS